MVEFIGEFIDFMANIKLLGDITIYRYSLAMRDFDINQLSQEYINQYVQSKRNSPHIRGAMLCFFEFAGVKKEFDMPPKATGRKEKRVKREISKEEHDDVSKYLYSQSFRDGLMFNIIYDGALRISDVKSIKINSFLWNDFLVNGKSCKLVVRGKGKKSRTVLIGYETMEKIFNHYAKKMDLGDETQLKMFINSPTNLFRKEGVILTEWQIWSIIHTASLKAIGRDIRPHELRSARATELLEVGIPIHHLKTYLGHTSIGTTEIYLHQDDKKSIDNIQNVLEEKQ